MKLKDIFVAVTVTLMAIAIAAPADAQIKCKSKQDKKTGEIGYSFVNKAGGTVFFSFGDYDVVPGDFWGSFANENTCQAGGKGRNCVVSNDPAEAAIAPAGCKIYMADLASGDKCELYIKGCQPAQRPLPTTGWYSNLNDPPTFLWDAETGISWYISPDNQARSLDDHKTYLADVLNGGKSDGTDFACQTDGCDLELPTLAQLKKLGADCAGIASLVIDPMGDNIWTYSGGMHLDLCTALWPDPDLAEPGNCAWTSTLDASQPNTHAYAVCLQQSGSRTSRATMVEYALIVAMTADLPAAAGVTGILSISGIKWFGYR